MDRVNRLRTQGPRRPVIDGRGTLAAAPLDDLPAVHAQGEFAGSPGQTSSAGIGPTVHLHCIAEPLFCRNQPALARIARTGLQIAQHLPANGEQRRHPFRRLFTRAKVHRNSGAVTPLQREQRPGHVRGDDGFGEAVVLSLLLGRVHGLQRLAVAANSRQQKRSRRRRRHTEIGRGRLRLHERLSVAAQHGESPGFSPMRIEAAIDRGLVVGECLWNVAGHEMPFRQAVEGVRLRRSQLHVGLERADRVSVRLVSSTRARPETWTPAHASKAACANQLSASLSARRTAGIRISNPDAWSVAVLAIPRRFCALAVTISETTLGTNGRSGGLLGLPGITERA